MALLVCRKCGTKFSVGAPFCPQCTAEDAYIEGTEEDNMPRNTVAGASLGVAHPDFDPDGPVPPIVPVGGALDAPIADQIAALDQVEQLPDGGYVTDDGAEHVAEASDEPRHGVEVPLGETAELTNQPAKKAPAKKATPKAASK